MLASIAFPLMIVIVILTTVMGMPMGISMIVSSIFYLILSGRDVGLAAEMVLNGVFGNFVALAVPLFIFAANIMNASQISDRLLKFALALVGRLPGGLGQVNVFTSLLFSGMSGSAVSDVAGVGKILTNMMTEDNRYPRGFAGAVTASVRPRLSPAKSDVRRRSTRRGRGGQGRRVDAKAGTSPFFIRGRRS